MLKRFIFTLRACLWFLSENELNLTEVVKQVFFCFGQILGQSDFFESKTEISFRIFFCIGRLCWAEIDLEVSKNGSRERFSNSSRDQFNKSSEAHYTELRSTSQSHTKMASLTSLGFIERPLVYEPRIGPIFLRACKFLVDRSRRDFTFSIIFMSSASTPLLGGKPKRNSSKTGSGKNHRRNDSPTNGLADIFTSTCFLVIYHEAFCHLVLRP